MSETFEVGISAELAEKIRAYGVETYPYECCGALLGRENSSGGAAGVAREVLGLFPLVNRRDDSPRNRFAVTSEDVRDAEKAATAQGLEVIGWYHSHPDHPARPSDFDRDHAWPWYSYVIVSVDTGVSKDMTSWRLKDDRSGYFEEKILRLQVRAAN
jgi:proteasome lid subunit RPN8/RPN11